MSFCWGMYAILLQIARPLTVCVVGFSRHEQVVLEERRVGYGKGTTRAGLAGRVMMLLLGLFCMLLYLGGVRINVAHYRAGIILVSGAIPWMSVFAKWDTYLHICPESAAVARPACLRCA